MSGAFVLVQSDADHGPDLLEDLLRSRGREIHMVARDAGEALPAPGSARAVVILGGATADEELKAWAARAVADGLPVLATGLGASALLDGVAAVTPVVAGVSPTEAAKGDELFEGLAAGTGLVTTAAITPTADAWVLAESESGPAAVRLGERAYALGFEPQHDAAWLRDQRPDLDEEARDQLVRRNRILRPHTIALLGRWVDGVVGRTEDEAPWGRSGPPPEPRAGLYLNPAP